MTNDHIILLALLSAIAIGAVVAFKIRQRSIARRNLDQVMKENKETQEFVLARLDSIGKLLADTSISSSDLRQRSDALFAELESRNVRGDLTPLIEDTRAYLDGEIDKRISV